MDSKTREISTMPPGLKRDGEPTSNERLTKRDDKQDAARWRVIEYLLLGDEPADDAQDFRTMIAEIAYSHQIDIGINRPAPSTLELIDELVAGYARGSDL